jgi:biopolymer transport protein ExbD
MGMSSGGHKGGPSSEINVTPLIDVLLVLLIIFLVVMPIMMKMETLTIPRKIDDSQEQPDKDASMLNLKVLVTGDVVYNDGNADEVLKAADLLGRLRPKIEGLKAGIEKVVFVDFEDGVPWNTVVGTMDQIRSLATDSNHDDVKVALKVREDKDKANAPQ